jgi:hypothetical protein
MLNTNTKTKIKSYKTWGWLFIILSVAIFSSILFFIKDMNSTITLMYGKISVINYIGISLFIIASIWFIFIKYDKNSIIKNISIVIVMSYVIKYICSSNSTIALLMIGQISVIQLFFWIFSAVLALLLGMYWALIKKGRFCKI